MPTDPHARYIGQNVVYWRKRRGRSQRALAGLAGISQPYLSYIERGIKGVDSRALEAKLANALEISVADLTAQPGTPADPARTTAAAHIPAIREALLRRELGDRGTPDPTLDRLIAAGGAYDFATAAPLIPNLILGLNGADFVQASYFVGYTLKHLGHPDLAMASARLAVAEARELGDPAWIGIGEYIRVHAMPMEMPDAPTALAKRIADEIQPHTGDPRVRQAYGMLHLYAALRSAIDGKRPLAVDHLTEARQAADSLGEPTGLGHAKFAFGPTNVGFWETGIRLELREPRQALDAARRVDPTLIPVANRQAPFYADVATALAQIGKDQEAIATFLRSEAIGPQWFRLRPTVSDTIGVIIRRTKRNALSTQMRSAAVATNQRQLLND
ncbi:helix-turn-helix domain-containing protein [Actinoplanes sp. NBRC 101535]|uniref:helix-turn-helix domain-containing protein n=1 Tax=Actinoplanes sp. NBRC 101535 TaxID=3032196 RepID=UPI0024A50955|nr:helix-turn-helix domain-containing protein [Actinoplanes sp. NBRC 101535]GLY08201.1 transcriptional regulator [Actinoplanes sp. NBRC 101535]